MPLKDLSGRTVYDLEFEDFEKLFCRQCKDCGICDKDPKSVDICMSLIDSGIWDKHLRKPQGR
jgi:hypothetical protein